MLKAHSRDLGQRQQLVHAKLHQGHPPTKSAGVSSHLLLLIASASVVMQSAATVLSFQRNVRHCLPTVWAVRVIVFLQCCLHMLPFMWQPALPSDCSLVITTVCACLSVCQLGPCPLLLQSLHPPIAGLVSVTLFVTHA